MGVHVDVVAERVAVDGLELSGQWVDFYALLALARADRSDTAAFVSAAAVARVGPWRHKAAASVGKEVARHIALLKRGGRERLLEHRGRTRAWRLALDSGELTFHPDRDRVSRWIEARSAGTAPAKPPIDDLRALVEASAMMQDGAAGLVIERLAALSPGLSEVEPALEAWSALLLGRAMSQHLDDDDEALARLADEWSKRTDAPGRAVGARLRASLGLRYRFEDPEVTLASLSRLAADLEVRGDIGSLGAVLNVMGLLTRRAGRPDAAAAHHRRPAALFGICGDHGALQATLFNLSLCRRETLERGGEPPDASVLALVELCRFVCARFGVGADSAQAEIAGAQWSHERGDTERAREYLAAAEALIQKLESTYDQAYYLEARALIEHGSPQRRTNPVRDLRAAVKLYDQIGDVTSAGKLRRRLRAMDE